MWILSVLVSSISYGFTPVPTSAPHQMKIVSAQGLLDQAENVQLTMLKATTNGPIVGFTLTVDGESNYYRVYERHIDCGTVIYDAISAKNHLGKLVGNFLYVLDHTKRQCGDNPGYKWIASLQEKDPFSVQPIQGELIFVGNHRL